MEYATMVSVLCTTYNHEKFIRDALNGILNQKTNFKYEVIVHDDASTDNTVNILHSYEREYADCVKLILQAENQFQKGRNIALEYMFPLVRGKYIAFCEGDDYWVDEYKLQKQIDFLEANPEYSMCMHNAYRLNYETGEQKKLDTFPDSGTYDQEKQILAGLGTDFPAFASYVLRTEFLEKMPEFFMEAKVLDYPLRQYYANCGKIYYFSEPMSVYRVSTPNSYMKQTAKKQEFYNQYTIGMIRFFEKLNNYTGKKFQHILESKIDSDYWGFCTSVSENAGMRLAVAEKLDINKIMSCYKKLRLDYLDECVQELYKESRHLFIYGTSRLAMICKEQLQNGRLSFGGFVVSDNQMKPDMIDGEKVYYLSEVLARYENIGFVLAVQPVNVNVIAQTLKKRGVDQYCVPYT